MSKRVQIDPLPHYKAVTNVIQHLAAYSQRYFSCLVGGVEAQNWGSDAMARSHLHGGEERFYRIVTL